MKEKIKSLKELVGVVKREKAAGKTIGFTNGCFDILHLGHVKYLAEAKKYCDLLIIGVNSDRSVKRIKGEGRPVNDQEARLEVLSALEMVDHLTLFDQDTPEELIRALAPSVLFKGGDWKEKDIVGADFVKDVGGEVRVIPFLKGYSTTALIQKLKA